VLHESRDVHGELVHRAPPALAELLSFVTPYERRWIAEGRPIHYLQVRLPGQRDDARIEAALEALQGSRRLSAMADDGRLAGAGYGDGELDGIQVLSR
jgi:hypothetical protein